ncbi:hypothetical protein HS088_TW22G00315 [Tripterygium wilfordii]|uniref:Uncharacterized protein n=1 Tax=Tripterygium wilfordii TaxID=458696 RepID=A0A7J7BY52_TRIWF|nr:hypothetical protein HS088_TW22G00315 [Tripterygium wilfordii]
MKSGFNKLATAPQRRNLRIPPRTTTSCSGWIEESENEKQQTKNIISDLRRKKKKEKNEEVEEEEEEEGLERLISNDSGPLVDKICKTVREEIERRKGEENAETETETSGGGGGGGGVEFDKKLLKEFMESAEREGGR